MKQISEQTYNNMLKKVETITTEIAKENIDLDELINKIEEGYKLLDNMKERLTEAKMIIEKIEAKYEDN